MKTSSRSVLAACLVLSAACFISLAEMSSAQTPIAGGKESGNSAMNTKLDSIILPEVKLEKVLLSDAIEKVRAAAHDHDGVTSDPEAKGVNIFLKIPQTAQDRIKEATITLDAKGDSLRKVLMTVAQQAGLKVKVESYAVALVLDK